VEHCNKTVYGSRGLSSWACDRKGKFERNGKWYCGTHDPERLKAKRDRYQAAFDAEGVERQAMREAERKIEELGRGVPEIAAQYAVVDAARERLHAAITARRKVR
jgi:uncharacterized Zn finger protein (UPF0148 family)